MIVQVISNEHVVCTDKVHDGSIIELHGKTDELRDSGSSLKHTHSNSPKTDNRQSTEDIVLINLEALKTEPKGSRHPSPEPTHTHQNIPTIKVWGGEADMFTAKRNQGSPHEAEQLMPKTSNSSHFSDDEVSAFSDTDQDKSLINKVKESDLHSLSSLEDDDRPSFASSCLVVSEYNQTNAVDLNKKTLDDYTVITNENTNNNERLVSTPVQAFESSTELQKEEEREKQSRISPVSIENSDELQLENPNFISDAEVSKPSINDWLKLKKNSTSSNDSHEMNIITDTLDNKPDNEHESSFINPLTKEIGSTSQKSSLSSIEHGTELSNYADKLDIPGSPKRSPSSSIHTSEHENDGLLTTENAGEARPHSSLANADNDDADNNSDEINDDNDDDDTASTGSEFRGSLGIDVDPGEWLSEIRVNLDIRLGRDEWSTAFRDAEGDTTQGSWDTSLLEIAASKATEEDWQTSLQDISKLNHEEDRQAWKTSIPENLEHTEVPEDWSTKINTIEKVNPITNTWNTIFNKIKEHMPTKKEWKTTFNSIGKNTVDKNEWKFRMPEKMTNKAKKDDWKTRINKLGDVTIANDPWKFRDAEMLVTSTEDRITHWSTVFKEIGKRGLDFEQWQTIMRSIAPNDDKDTWAFKFAEMAKNINSEEDWKIKFLEIAENMDEEQYWSILMNDVPNSYKEPEDWETTFKAIEDYDPEANPWDTTFNDIIPNGDESEFWTNTMNETDITDMSRDTWDSTFNEILPNEGTDSDWTITLHPIEGLAEE